MNKKNIKKEKKALSTDELSPALKSLDEIAKHYDEANVDLLDPGFDTCGMTEKQVEKALEPFPQEALSTYGGNKKLTSIKAQYIVERLNEVFGYGTWNTSEEIVLLKELPYKTKSGVENALTVIMKVTLHTPNTKPITHFGGARYKSGAQDYNDVFKSALTDGLTKCASHLGIGNDVFKGLVEPPSSGYSNYRSSMAKSTQNTSLPEDIDLSALTN